MINLIKNKNYVEILGDKSSLETAKKFIIPELTIINEKYKYIERNLWSMSRKVTTEEEAIEDMLSEIRQLKKSSSKKDKKMVLQLREEMNEKNKELQILKQKRDNIKKFLKFNPEQISFYKERKDSIDSFEIGFLRKVKEILTKNNIVFKVKSKYGKSPKIKTNPKNYNRRYQYTAVKKILLYKRGIIKLPTGSGKTEIARSFIQTILPYNLRKEKRVIFIVEQKDLLLQTKDENFHFKENVRIGLVGDGIIQHLEPIVIATVQTLSSLYKEEPKYFKEWAKTFSACIIDECDMFTTEKRLKIIRMFTQHCHWNVFLTATPFSRFKPIERMKLIGVSGDIIYTVEESYLQEKGFLSKQKGFFVKSYNIDNQQYFPPKKRWLNIYDKLIRFGKYRNNLIFEIYKILDKLKLRSLFIVESLEHGVELQKKMKVPFYSGSNDNLERKIAKQEIESGVNPIIITTRIFRRAINIPELQVYVNCAGYKSDNIVMQSKGRIGRIKKKSKSKGVYLDIFDYGNEILENHSEERITTLKENNVEVDLIDIKNLENQLIKFLEL